MRECVRIETVQGGFVGTGGSAGVLATKADAADGWPVVEVSQMTTGLLHDLFDGGVAALRLPGFCSTTECQAIVARAREVGFSPYAGVTPRIDKIGITQIEHTAPDRDRDDYFSGIPAAASIRDSILAAGGKTPGLLDRVMTAFDLAWPAGAQIARESDGRQYFMGVLRAMESARLHIDWARNDAEDWGIGGIEAQLAWNVYLESDEQGGDLRIHRRAWNPSIEGFKSTGNYGYDDDAVRDVSSVSVTPRTGELVVFSPQYLHEVLPKRGDKARTTIGSFVGKTPGSGPLVLWS